jgi:hypothetical protein
VRGSPLPSRTASASIRRYSVSMSSPGMTWRHCSSGGGRGRRLSIVLLMSMLGIPGNEWFNWFKSLTPEFVAYNRQQSCVAKVRDQLSQAIANPGLHSPELESLYGKAQNLTAHAKP